MKSVIYKNKKFACYDISMISASPIIAAESKVYLIADSVKSCYFIVPLSTLVEYKLVPHVLKVRQFSQK